MALRDPVAREAPPPPGGGGRARFGGIGASPRAAVADSHPVAVSPARRRSLVALWIVAVLAGTGFVIYGFGSVSEARAQRRLMREIRGRIGRASNEGSGLFAVQAPSKAPELGAPVAILEVGPVHVQQVVVEGAGSSQTRNGPGHVTGTAAPGQPGNSVVLGRAHGFGGYFGGLGRLHRGAQIVVSTTQGQSVYRVASVRHLSLGSQGAVDKLYGPSDDDRLTLVTSASALPWSSSSATVVVATMRDEPFPPTPQNGRVDAGTGLHGDGSATAAVVLALLVFGATMSATVVLYRTLQPATAYLLTIGPVLASTVIAGETVSRLLPGWT